MEPIIDPKVISYTLFPIFYSTERALPFPAAVFRLVPGAAPRAEPTNSVPAAYTSSSHIVSVCHTKSQIIWPYFGCFSGQNVFFVGFHKQFVNLLSHLQFFRFFLLSPPLLSLVFSSFFCQKAPVFLKRGLFSSHAYELFLPFMSFSPGRLSARPSKHRPGRR